MKINWQTKKLGEIGKIFNGNSINERIKKEKYFNLKNGIPFIATKDINFETHLIDYNNDVKIPLIEKNFKIAHKNSVLVCAEGGSAGRKIAFNINDICFGNKLFAIETKADVNPKLVYYWYLTPMFFDSFKLQMNGIIGGVSIGNFKNIQIPIPHLSEQHRLVKILDETFEKIEKVKENAAKNLQNVKEFFESYLNNIFVNPRDNWGRKKLKEVCIKLFAGGDVPKNNFSKVKNNKYNIPIFANGFKNKGLFGYTNIEKVIEPCITISARGTIGYAETREEPFFPVVRLIVLIPNTKIVDLYFLYYMTHNFKFSNTGTSIPQLTIPMIENIIIPMPAVKEQKSIVTKLDALSTQTKKLEAIYKQKLADLEELKKSILKKAFNGEL